MRKLFFAFLFLIMSTENLMANEKEHETAVFAAGCFWCIQPPFDKTEGVISTEVGFSGGAEKDPGYKDVATGRTSHYEAIRVVFDPKVITYQEIIDIFWKNIDPFDDGGQFCDRGNQYKSAVFYADKKQKSIALETKQKISEDKRQEVLTEVLPAINFYLADDYHQKFYKKNPSHYKRYRMGCKRDQRLDQLWNN